MRPDLHWLPLLKSALERDCPAVHDLVVEETDTLSDPDILTIDVRHTDHDALIVGMCITFSERLLRIRTAIYTTTVRASRVNGTFSSILLCTNQLAGDNHHRPFGALHVVRSGDGPYEITVLNEYTLPMVPIDNGHVLTVQELLTQLIVSLYYQATRYQKYFMDRDALDTEHDH